jgi:hypothetical protein
VYGSPFPGVSGKGVKLNTSLSVVLRLKKSGPVPPLPLLLAFMAWAGTTLPLTCKFIAGRVIPSYKQSLREPSEKSSFSFPVPSLSKKDRRLPAIHPIPNYLSPINNSHPVRKLSIINIKGLDSYSGKVHFASRPGHLMRCFVGFIRLSGTRQSVLGM